MSRVLMLPAKNENKGQQPDEQVSFKKKLLSRCQEEFQKEKLQTSSYTKDREDLLKEMESAEGSQKKKELDAQLEDLNRRMRKKYVGVNRCASLLIFILAQS